MRNDVAALKADKPFVQICIAKGKAHFQIGLTVFQVVTNFIDLGVYHMNLVSNVFAIRLRALKRRVVAHRVLLE